VVKFHVNTGLRRGSYMRDDILLRPMITRPVLLVVAIAAAFGYMHAIFRNGWAVGLSFLAGILFAALPADTIAVRFRVRTRSLWLPEFPP